MLKNNSKEKIIFYIIKLTKLIIKQLIIINPINLIKVISKIFSMENRVMLQKVCEQVNQRCKQMLYIQVKFHYKYVLLQRLIHLLKIWRDETDHTDSLLLQFYSR